MDASHGPRFSRDVPSYFLPSVRRAQCSTDSTGVSPGSSPVNRPKAQRPVLHDRSKSEHASSRVRPDMRTIAEGVILEGSATHRYGADVVESHLAVRSRNSSLQRTPSSELTPSLHPLRHDRPSLLYPHHSAPAGLLSRRWGRWTRTQSGEVWSARPSSSDTSRGNASQSSDNSAPRSYVSRSDRVWPAAVSVPLRPPNTGTPTPPRATYSHTVKIEKSFTDVVEETPAPVAPPRGLSIVPKAVITASTRFLRQRSTQKSSGRKRQRSTQKSSGRKGSGSDTSSRRLPSPGSPAPRDHVSVLKRRKTAEVLSQVTALLRTAEQDVSHNSSRPQTMAASRPSTKTVAVARPKNGKRADGYTGTHQRFVPFPMLKRKASHWSETSSIRDLRMGVGPMNTPDPKETYKVKRSRSADTEEFLKVDISHRGGTSYLPSEARRIHTPPLPGANYGRRRGFFFDHNAPAEYHEHPATDPTPGMPSSDKSKQSGGRYVTSTARSGGRHGDWYETQLAELDVEHGPYDCAEHSRRYCNPNEDTTVIDYNIPEHLPSSPLCPKHPRYWRAVQGKLKAGEDRERLCWMHGKLVVSEQEGADNLFASAGTGSACTVGIAAGQ